MGTTKIIALAGKGGVGKTSVSAAFVRLLMEARPEAKILAIDADPAVGLSTALGIEVAATLDDIRKDITMTLSKILEGMPTDCGACNLKPICDEVEGMKELHFGKESHTTE